MKRNKETVKRLSKLNKFILLFFLFAFMGWIMETIYAFIVLGHFSKRGFLYGPLCPIYGFGALILIIFLGKYRGKNIKLFFYSSVIFSLFEYLVSYFLDALFSMNWWDYTNDFMNLNGRISIFYSVAWGIIAILFINYIYPFIKKKFNKILSKTPYLLQIITIIFSIVTIIFDFILSSVKYLL